MNSIVRQLASINPQFICILYLNQDSDGMALCNMKCLTSVYSLYFRMAIDVLWPPKPKAFDNAT